MYTYCLYVNSWLVGPWPHAPTRRVVTEDIHELISTYTLLHVRIYRDHMTCKNVRIGTADGTMVTTVHFKAVEVGTNVMLRLIPLATSRTIP